MALKLYSDEKSAHIFYLVFLLYLTVYLTTIKLWLISLHNMWGK